LKKIYQLGKFLKIFSKSLIFKKTYLLGKPLKILGKTLILEKTYQPDKLPTNFKITPKIFKISLLGKPIKTLNIANYKSD